MEVKQSNFPYNYFKCCLERNSESTIGSRSRPFDADYVNDNRTSDDQEDVEEEDEEDEEEANDKCEIIKSGQPSVHRNKSQACTNAFNTMNYLDVEKLIKSLGNDEKKLELLKKKLSVYIRSKQRQANLSFEQSTMADATETGRFSAYSNV